MSEIKLSDLADKIRNAAPMTEDERNHAATLVMFSETIGTAVEASSYYNMIATLAGYAEGESAESGDTPMFFVLACDEPHPETWAAIQAVLHGDDEAQPQPVPDPLREALEWYQAQVAGCRKVTSEGDEARRLLDHDGGARARAALAAGGEG